MKVHNPSDYRRALEFLERKRPEHLLGAVRPDIAARRIKVIRSRRKVKLDVLMHYCDGPPRCACVGCDVTFPEHLTIDHIDGGGRAHRLTYRGSIYNWLKRNHFPPGFRVLCINCNLSLGSLGYCPHNKEINGSTEA